MPRVRELTTNRRIIDVRKQRDDVKVCITLAIPGETEKTEITHTKKRFPFLHQKLVWNLISCLVNLD